MILLQTLGFGHLLSRITVFGSGSVRLLYSGEPETDDTGDPKRFRCPIMGSSMILLLTLGFGPVLPLRSGEPTADGTGDPIRVRCPIIGSCIILLQTPSFGDPLS